MAHLDGCGRIPNSIRIEEGASDGFPGQRVVKATAILLLDDCPQARAARAKHLTRLGFHVEVASSFGQAKVLWRPNRYALVLFAVTRDIHLAAEFCEQIKREHPRQVVGMLVPSTSQLPPTQCPDLLWPEEDLEYFLARVEILAHFAPAA